MTDLTASDISPMLADCLAKLGIRLSDYGPGEHYTICPQCSAKRKKKTAKCLSVKIDDDGGAVWNCHHADCGWT